MISRAFLDELRARLPVSEVVGRRVRLRKTGQEWKGLSLFNNERTPSFFVNDHKGFFHDFSSGKHGDIFAFVMETEGINFREAVDRVASIAGMAVGVEDALPMPKPAAPPARKPDQRELLNRRRALEIWKEAVDLGGTLATRYLASRKLILPAGVSGHALRFHPQCPWRDDQGRLVQVPALVGLYRDVVTNEPKAIHRVALTADGRKFGRRALGSKAGCAIKLTADEDVTYGLHVGEGIETMLAAMMLGFAPAWALGDTGNLKSFSVLAGIDALTIVVDHDKNGAGQKASAECFDRWTAAGREVWCVLPNEVGADMNDIGGAS